MFAGLVLDDGLTRLDRDYNHAMLTQSTRGITERRPEHNGRFPPTPLDMPFPFPDLPVRAPLPSTAPTWHRIEKVVPDASSATRRSLPRATTSVTTSTLSTSASAPGNADAHTAA